MHHRFLSIAAGLITAMVLPVLTFADTPATAPVTAPVAPLRKAFSDVFDAKPPLMLQDDFSSSPNPLKRWVLNADDHYDIATVDPERLDVIDAPGLPNAKAVRFFVKRAVNSFRSEITLPSENGWNERWYGERVALSKDWVIDPSKERTIVMQWHGLPGNFRATYPNLALTVQNNQWSVARSFGDPKTKPTRDYVNFDDPIQPGAWVSWVLHAKWSPTDEGLLQLWKNDKLILERKGPNVYGTIGIEYTPYLQTGIYQPSWHVTNDAQQKRYQQEDDSKTPVTGKTVFITDVKVGGAQATYKDIAPSALAGGVAVDN